MLSPCQEQAPRSAAAFDGVLETPPGQRPELIDKRSARESLTFAAPVLLSAHQSHSPVQPISDSRSFLPTPSAAVRVRNPCSVKSPVSSDRVHQWTRPSRQRGYVGANLLPLPFHPFHTLRPGNCTSWTADLHGPHCVCCARRTLSSCLLAQLHSQLPPLTRLRPDPRCDQPVTTLSQHFTSYIHITVRLVKCSQPHPRSVTVTAGGEKATRGQQIRSPPSRTIQAGERSQLLGFPRNP